eukprot:6206404-Pleurochrysis_carterae.AAC.1
MIQTGTMWSDAQPTTVLCERGGGECVCRSFLPGVEQVDDKAGPDLGEDLPFDQRGLDHLRVGDDRLEHLLRGDGRACVLFEGQEDRAERSAAERTRLVELRRRDGRAANRIFQRQVPGKSARAGQNQT